MKTENIKKQFPKTFDLVLTDVLKELNKNVEKSLAYHVYQGWINYETWSVYNVLSNEYNLNRLLIKVCKDMNKLIPRISEDEAVNLIAEWIKDSLNNRNPLSEECNIFSCLLDHAISKVDFEAIAYKFLFKKMLHR